MNECRTAAIRKAYEKLDVTKDGQVTLDDVARLYDASKHPAVVNGTKDE